MKPGDKAKFLEVLAGVHDFYGKELSEFAGTVWMQSVQGFELADVTRALSAHLMDPERGQFMPKPSDLVRQLQGTQADRSLIAWGKVLDAMQRVGAYESVAFDDAAIHAAIMDMGGWSQVCRTKLDDLPFVQRRFTDAHKAYSSRGTFDYPGHLPGLHEAANAMAGQRVKPPMLIGDAERARAVAALGVAGSKTAITAGDAVRPMLVHSRA